MSTDTRKGACLVLRVSPISFTVGPALSLWAGEFFILQTEDTKMWKCLKPPYWVKVAIIILLVRKVTNPSQFRNDRCMHAKSHPTLCNSMDCSPSGSCVHGILQTRILE